MYCVCQYSVCHVQSIISSPIIQSKFEIISMIIDDDVRLNIIIFGKMPSFNCSFLDFFLLLTRAGISDKVTMKSSFSRIDK